MIEITYCTLTIKSKDNFNCDDKHASLGIICIFFKYQCVYLEKHITERTTFVAT